MSWFSLVVVPSDLVAMWSDRDMEEHSVYDHRNTNGGSSVHVGVGGNGGVGTTRSGHSPHSVLFYF